MPLVVCPRLRPAGLFLCQASLCSPPTRLQDVAMSDNLPQYRPCCSGPCGGSIDRREFVRLIGLGAGAAAAAAGGMPQAVMAGPFERADFARLVPADKKLNPSGSSRSGPGGPRTYRAPTWKDRDAGRRDLRRSTLLGGDGRLLVLGHLQPLATSAPAPTITPSRWSRRLPWNKASPCGSKRRQGDGAIAGPHGLCSSEFCGEYPLGPVEYRGQDLPVTVSLEAYSPFVPLAPDDSGFPATVLQFTVKNIQRSAGAGRDVAGWLENGVGPAQPLELAGAAALTRIVRAEGLSCRWSARRWRAYAETSAAAGGLRRF